MFIFRDDEMLINYYKKSSGWFVGDILNQMRVPEHCSIARIDSSEHKTDSMDGIISGGLMN